MRRVRKWLTFVLAIVMLFSLTACGGQGANGTNRDNDTKGEQEKESFDAQTVLSQLEVTEYRTTAGSQDAAVISDGERQLVYRVKNNSNFHVKLTFKITTYNAKNEVVQILHEKIGLVESGVEAILKCVKLKEYETCTYEIQVEEKQVDESATDKLSYEIIETEKKIFLTLTNNSEKRVSAYKYLLCFEGDEMVYCHEFVPNIMLAGGDSSTDEWDRTYGLYKQYDVYQPVVFGCCLF